MNKKNKLKNKDDENFILSLENEELFFDRLMINHWMNIKRVNTNYIVFENNMEFLFYIQPEKNDYFNLILKRKLSNDFCHFANYIVHIKDLEKKVVELVDSLAFYNLIYYNLFI